MDKTVAIEVAKLRDLYQRSDKKTRVALESLYGKDVLVPGDEEIWEQVKQRLLNNEQPNGAEVEAVIAYVDKLRSQEKPAGPKLTPWVVKDESGKVRGIGVPIINKVVALKDAYDGKEVEWEKAVKAGAPTRDDWYIILYFKKEINRLLDENGGDPIRDDYYWSSTEYNTGNAWYVYFLSGLVTYTYKYGSGVVRPVAAL